MRWTISDHTGHLLATVWAVSLDQAQGERTSLTLPEGELKQENDPESPLGSFFKGVDQKIYRCTAWHYRWGYWMIPDDGELKLVSERSIGRTFHEVSR